MGFKIGNRTDPGIKDNESNELDKHTVLTRIWESHKLVDGEEMELCVRKVLLPCQACIRIEVKTPFNFETGCCGAHGHTTCSAI